ncbi:MAG: FGGY family carbohydrate kinase [Microbacterium sp.]
MTAAVLGIDAGTTGVKAVLYGLAGDGGAVLATGYRSVAVSRGAGGRAESDPEEIWDAVAGAVRDAVADAGGDAVAAIGITGQGDGAWLVGPDGRPVRPAALWLDGRGAARVAEWEADGRNAAVIAATGSSIFPGTLPILLEELSADEPDAVVAAAHHLNCKDWIRFRLTGEAATDPSEASRTYLDVGTGEYSDAMVDRLGHEHWRRLLPAVLDPLGVAGRVTPQAARDLGLAAGTPVAAGWVDSAACPVGLGAIDDGAGFIVLGTTATVAVNHAHRRDVRSDVAIVISTGRGTQVIEALSSMTGSPNVDWARRTLGFADRSWDEIEAQLRAVPHGSGGIVYLPYGSPSGERAPFVDTAASASWLGTSVTTTPAELFRAVFEGLAFSMSECLDILGADRVVRICGGGARSNLMCQLLADASGRTVVRAEDDEAGARGAATGALVAAGIAADLPEAVRLLRQPETTFEPRPDRPLADARAAFIAVRDAVRPHWGALRALRQG